MCGIEGYCDFSDPVEAVVWYTVNRLGWGRLNRAISNSIAMLGWAQVESFILNSPFPAVAQGIGTAEKQKEK